MDPLRDMRIAEGEIVSGGSPGQAGSRKSGGDGAAEKEQVMRLDKYLKVSRIIKRRTVANEGVRQRPCDAER